jgi:hypothetical protein
VKDKRIIEKTIGFGLAADWLEIFNGGRKNEAGKFHEKHGGKKMAAFFNPRGRSLRPGLASERKPPWADPGLNPL